MVADNKHLPVCMSHTASPDCMWTQIETKTYGDGSRYEGEMQDGKWHGRGVYSWADRRRYEGEFRAGKRDGNGTLLYLDGRMESNIVVADVEDSTRELSVPAHALVAHALSTVGLEGCELAPRLVRQLSRDPHGVHLYRRCGLMAAACVRVKSMPDHGCHVR